MTGSGQLFPECYLGQGWTLCRQWGVTTRWRRGGGAHGVSISKVPWYLYNETQVTNIIAANIILAIFIYTWIWSTLCKTWTPAPDPGSKLHLHMWVYHIKSLLTRPLRVLNPCFPMLNKIAKFLHHFLQLRHRNPPRKSAAFCRYISNISDKLMRVVERELFNFDTVL